MAESIEVDGRTVIPNIEVADWPGHRAFWVQVDMVTIGIVWQIDRVWDAYALSEAGSYHRLGMASSMERAVRNVIKWKPTKSELVEVVRKSAADGRPLSVEMADRVAVALVGDFR